MKSLLLLSVLLFSTAVAVQLAADAPDRNAESQSRLVGAWKLASLEEASADGQVHKADCNGMFVFTSDGKASVQVMYRNAQTGSALGAFQVFADECSYERTVDVKRESGRAVDVVAAVRSLVAILRITKSLAIG